MNQVKPRVVVVSGHLSKSDSYVEVVKRNHRAYCERHGYSYLFADNFITNDQHKDFARETNYVWLKVDIVLNALNQGLYDYFFWIDSDSIFFDLDLSLDDLINMERNLVFTGDSWDVFNSGHFLIRNSSWSKDFIRNWWRFRYRAFPNLPTTHKNDSGFLGDQPAANILLAGGFNFDFDNESLVLDNFNKINGYRGNEKRHHKFFHYFYAPTNSIKVKFATRLIHESNRKHIKIVEQDRLNAYPFRLPGSKVISKPKIYHFPGSAKGQIESICAQISREPTLP